MPRDYRIVDNLDIHSDEGQRLVLQGLREIAIAEVEMPGQTRLYDFLL